MTQTRVLRAKDTAAMNAEIPSTRLSLDRDRDLDLATSRPPDAPQLRGTLMAEQGVPSAGEHRRCPKAELTHVRSADSKNPAMKAMQAAGTKPVGDPAPGQAELDELGAGDNPMLASGERPNGAPERFVVA